MNASVITLANETLRDKAAVRLCFEKNFPVVDKVKSSKGDGWSQSRGFRYIPQSEFKLSEVFDKLSAVAWLDYSALKSKTPNEVPKIEKQKPLGGKPSPITRTST